MTKKKKSVNYKKVMKTLSKNYWAISTVVLAILLIAVLATGGLGGTKVSADEAGQKVLEFANNQGANAELVEVNKDGSFYEVILTIQGQEVPVYVTKDGENLVPQLIPLSTDETQAPTQQAPTPTQTTYSKEDLVKIKDFSQCLADNGVKAYGAGWCGYCKKLKEAFGGAEQIEPFYLECQNADRTNTEYAELCQQEQISGFPTIKINGELYNGARTIDGLAAAVDECEAPEVEGIETQATQVSGYTEEDFVKLKEFNNCLGEKDVKVYGANWCGWTKKWVDTLGGVDAASAVYVECTEETELCSSEEIQGYPTTKINGETYSGDRTISAIAQATGCTAPSLEGSVATTDSATAGCGA
ncbi:MAG: thioredoxin domain-containing protein [Nitrososphaerales archaeon]|jgi:glutaredoxin|nr:thioredoxin domain-containing protein [Nitrososphaerales archaeon]